MKNPLDPTSKKSMLEHGIIVTDKGLFLKDAEEVVLRKGEKVLKMLDEARKLADKVKESKCHR
jgi:oligoribonuclease (3'-5' exoribonuclease)